MTDHALSSTKKPGRLRMSLLLLAGLLLTSATAGICWFAFFRKNIPPETSAVSAMRSYCMAQIIYHREDRDGDGILEYAQTLKQLADAGLIPMEMAEARGRNGVPYRGYLYLEMKTIAKTPIDWVNDFGLCAIPARYGEDGYRSFIVCTNGTVFPKDQGPKGTFETNYPADPVATNWFTCDCGDPE